MKQIELYTDGACRNNPGPGGWACILRFGKNEKILRGAFRRTTNNRMELCAVISGLAALKESCDVTVFSDSQYIVNGINRWIVTYGGKKWDGTTNGDLWELLEKFCKKHAVEAKWVKGHSGHAENERCDREANAAIYECEQKKDMGYETTVAVGGLHD